MPKVDLGHCTDPFLPGLPEDLIRAKKFDPVPAVIGGNSHEGITIMSQFLAHPALYANFTESLPQMIFNLPADEVGRNEKRLTEAVKK